MHLQREQLYCMLKKCEYDKAGLRFVGHMVDGKGILSDPPKDGSWPELAALEDLYHHFLSFQMAI